MEAEIWRKPPDIVGHVADNAQVYDFFQALRLLENAWGARSSDWLNHITLKPSREIGFPASDIRRIYQTGNEKIAVELGFMGLYGVDAAMPHYFIEIVQRNDETAETIRAFLDIFGRHFYELLYEAWAKYRIVIQQERGKQYIHDTSGPVSGEILDYSVVSSGANYAMLYGKRIHTVHGLESVVESFSGARTRIRQWVQKWVDVKDTARLGKTDNEPVLAENALLGTQLLDVGGSIGITIGPVNYRHACKLANDRNISEKLHKLISGYIGHLMDYQVIVLVHIDENIELHLGETDVVIGQRCWLGSSQRCLQSWNIGNISDKTMSSETMGTVNTAQSRRAA